MHDPYELQKTCSDLSYRDWFFACDRWWDAVGWEQASDWLKLPWEQRYASGFTVEQAVRAAHREVFGSDLPV